MAPVGATRENILFNMRALGDIDDFNDPSLILSVIAMLGLNANATAVVGAVDATLPAPSFGSLIERATKIARVKIISREPAYGDLLKLGPPCGYVFSAVVVEAFKGD